MHEFEVLISGAGVAGLSAALAMARCGYRVALIDAGTLEAKTCTQDIRVYAINKASETLLKELGAWSRLDAQRLSPYRQMYVWDGQNGAAIDFDARSIAAAHLGYIIEETVLKNALLAEISQNPLIRLFPHTSINELEHLKDAIQISNGQAQWQGQLLMIAEGARSPTRDKLGVKLNHWSYEQQAIVATVHTELSHQHTAYQVFHANGPLAFLPLVDKHHSSIVWSIDNEDSKALMQLSEEEFNQALTKAFGEKLGQVKLLSPRHEFPLTMRHAQAYVGPHWLLLGDAAHTIHPLAGLGLNLGLADVALIYQQLKTHKKGLGNSKLLSTYQRTRKAAVWESILLMEGFKRLFAVSAQPLSLLRGLGLNLCNQLAPLKRLFIRHAAGDQ